MKYNMYSVKDLMTGKYMNPMFTEAEEHSDSLAIRQFKSNLNNIKLWKDNPNDFELWLVGSFDDEAGCEAVVQTKICSGRSVLDAGKNEI